GLARWIDGDGQLREQCFIAARRARKMFEGRRVQGQGFRRERGGGVLRGELIGESQMYCPRCGSQNTEATKFCRQCGLALTQVIDYVSTGGTGTFARPPSMQPLPPPLMETAEMLSLKHKRTLT